MTDTLNAFCTESPGILLALMFVIGVCVGSFLNVLALRSLKEESIFWPGSYCFSCNHKLSALDNIPLFSYLFLKGKCRYCQAPISWQYPFVEFCTGLVWAAITYVFLINKIPLVNFDGLPVMVEGISNGLTHDLFSAIQQGRLQPSSPMSLNSEDLGFYKYGLFLSCLFFASTLITVTITDFREKLIPHEITYPSMIIGIAFSAVVRGDLLGTMAGIGASYMLFDFLAFYGLKFYMVFHKEEAEEDAAVAASQEQKEASAVAASKTLDSSAESLGAPASSRHLEDPILENSPAVVENMDPIVAENMDPSVSENKDPSVPENREPAVAENEPSASEKAEQSKEDDEEIEVMGGGDAVLSAVMSAYLGWKGLVLALIIGFLAGTVMGLILLFVEMKKAGLLRECGQKSLFWGAIFAGSMAALTIVFSILMGGNMSVGLPSALISLTLNSAILGLIAGGLIGMVVVGTRVSKPFPFGPALALGGFIAMFFIPYWLPFY